MHLPGPILWQDPEPGAPAAGGGLLMEIYNEVCCQLIILTRNG